MEGILRNETSFPKCPCGEWHLAVPRAVFTRTAKGLTSFVLTLLFMGYLLGSEFQLYLTKFDNKFENLKSLPEKKKAKERHQE
uniref:Uncharacterized protein n=1 Tax=Lynx canadensis TaxID=61383 RepID=A0A667G910_LYNCA